MTTNLLSEVSEAAQRVRPPLVVVGSSEGESFDNADVELRDGHVRWRIIRERSVLSLVACPDFDRRAWYDADLLKRLFGQQRANRGDVIPGSMEALEAMMRISVGDLIAELDQLRQPVADVFAEQEWESTRRELMNLGVRRDFERFGRPYPPKDR